MNGSNPGAVQHPSVERRAFARGRFPGPHASVDVHRLARIARRDAVDPPRLLDMPHVSRGRTSRDGNVLVMHADTPCSEEKYLAPMGGHLIAVHHGESVPLAAWTRARGYVDGCLQDGQTILIPAREAAFLKFRGGASATLIVLRPGVLESFANAATGDAAAQSPRLRGGALFSDGLFDCIGRALSAELRSDGLSGDSVLDLVGVALAAHLSTHYSDGDDARGAVGPLQQTHLTMVFDYVQSRMDETVYLEDLAALTGYSKHHFSHVFKAMTGLSPMRYVFKLKMERAREMVQSTAMSLTDIGGSVGYEDTAQFSRCFRRFWGATASAFRTQARRLQGAVSPPSGGPCREGVHGAAENVQ